MIDAQQENGTDEAPERDVRWEGKLARLENKAHEYNRVGLDWKLVEVEASTLERILTERTAALEAIEKVRNLHGSVVLNNRMVCVGCRQAQPCSTVKVLG